MDMRPTLLPQGEVQARKARELKRRGYSAAEIAAAMGVRKTRVEDLLRAAAAHKPAAEQRPEA
jgi:hypothetical protein